MNNSYVKSTQEVTISKKVLSHFVGMGFFMPTVRRCVMLSFSCRDTNGSQSMRKLVTANLVELGKSQSMLVQRVVLWMHGKRNSERIFFTCNIPVSSYGRDFR